MANKMAAALMVVSLMVAVSSADARHLNDQDSANSWLEPLSRDALSSELELWRPWYESDVKRTLNPNIRLMKRQNHLDEGRVLQALIKAQNEAKRAGSRVRLM